MTLVGTLMIPPELVLASTYFGNSKLRFVKKYYDGPLNFMFTHGLKFHNSEDGEDCALSGMTSTVVYVAPLTSFRPWWVFWSTREQKQELRHDSRRY